MGGDYSAMRRIDLTKNRESLPHRRLCECAFIGDLFLLFGRGRLLRRAIDTTEHLGVLDFIAFSESLFFFAEDFALKYSNRRVRAE